VLNSKKIPKKYALPKWFWIACIGIVVFILGSLGSVVFWHTGWPSYYQALQKCDGKPPVLAGGLLSSQYLAPRDEDYRIPGRPEFKEYFCSEAEAIEAGYHH